MSAGAISAIMLTLLILMTALFCVFVVQGASVAGVARSNTVTNSSHRLKSLCPELKTYPDADVKNSYRYHENLGKCYQIGTQVSACGNNTSFQPKDEVYGICDCKSESRILIYHPKTEQCYYIFQQGYCKLGQWLDVNRVGKPNCHKNPCAKFHSTGEMVLHNGQCVELGKPHSTCSDLQIIGFVKKFRLPKCINPVPLSRAIGVPPSACDVGSVNAIGGYCQPPFDFD